MGKRILEAVVSALLIAVGTKLIEKAFEDDEGDDDADKKQGSPKQ